MRFFSSSLFAVIFSGNALLAQDCPTLCDFEFMRSATIQTVQDAIDRGEDINALGEYGNSVFSILLTMNIPSFQQYTYEGDVVAEQARLDGLIWFFLASGVDLDALGYEGTSYLNLAARNASLPVVRHLVANGASALAVNTDQENALHYAAVGGNTETMDWLIQAGNNIDGINGDEETPLHLAAAFASFQPTATTIWLIENGANINAQGGRFSTTPMMDFVFNRAEERVAESPVAMRAALDAGYDVTLVNHAGNNILHYAAWVGRSPELIQLIIDHGADISVRNDEGDTAYDLALENYYLSDTEVMGILKP